MANDKDIFGYKRNPKPRGVFSSENSMLTLGGGDTSKMGYLVQNWQVQYTQQVQELFEIGSNELYWVKGRPAGQGSLGRVLGDKDVDTNDDQGFFPKSAYDLCEGGATMVLKAAGGHCEAPPTNGGSGVTLGGGINITMSGCAVTSIGFSMTIGDVRLVENYVWRFAYMQLEKLAA